MPWLAIPPMLWAQKPVAPGPKPVPATAPAVAPLVRSMAPPPQGVLEQEDAAGVFESVGREVNVVFSKCKDAVIRITAADSYGTHSGTGFFIDSNGPIYTCYTLTDRSWNQNVEFEDKNYPATCLLADPRSGVALLKIQADKTPYLSLGNSAEVRPSSPVIVVGYPMDLPASASFGLVAGLDQKILGQFLPTAHIRANVAVQPGEVGAPILNTRSEVIGIVSFGTLSGAACEALPIQAAERVRGDYTRFGEVRYGWVGMTADPVIKGDENSEVKITHLDEDTPAARSGLKDGDVLVSVKGAPIRKTADLREASFYLAAEETVPIVVRRDDKEATFNVRAARLPGKSLAEVPLASDGGMRLSLPQPR